MFLRRYFGHYVCLPSSPQYSKYFFTQTLSINFHEMLIIDVLYHSERIRMAGHCDPVDQMVRLCFVVHYCISSVALLADLKPILRGSLNLNMTTFQHIALAESIKSFHDLSSNFNLIEEWSVIIFEMSASHAYFRVLHERKSTVNTYNSIRRASFD